MIISVKCSANLFFNRKKFFWILPFHSDNFPFPPPRHSLLLGFLIITRGTVTDKVTAAR